MICTHEKLKSAHTRHLIIADFFPICNNFKSFFYYKSLILEAKEKVRTEAVCREAFRTYYTHMAQPLKRQTIIAADGILFFLLLSFKENKDWFFM